MEPNSSVVFSQQDRKRIRSNLREWFSESGKSYPWRETEDPWAILVSEIMLQQTTVASVISNRRFEKFLEEFPDLQTIAEASEEALLRAWEGLGYYNRVRNLQKTARAVLTEHGGTFPRQAEILANLPGIGPYTAGAVSSFAFNEAAPIVDGNIARVIARLTDYQEAIDSTTGVKFLWQGAEELLDREAPRLFNSALMELGQTHCSPRSPACLTCPVRTCCRAIDPEKLPIKKPRKQFVKVTEHTLLVTRGSQVLLSMGSGSRRKGFWHLPTRPEEEVAHLEARSQHRYTITHHRVTVLLYETAQVTPQEGEIFHELASLPDLPLASPIRKILQKEL